MSKVNHLCSVAGVLVVTGLMASTLLMTGCQRVSSEPAATTVSNATVPAGITGINHTSTYIAAFFVNDAYGGNISKRGEGGGGGTVTCCLPVPEHYTNGLKVHVRWNASNSSQDHWQERDVEVDPYPDGGGNAWVNFLPDGAVRIIVTNENLWGDSYQGPFKAPSDQWPALSKSSGGRE